jgi:hypothetical protein
MQPHDLKQLRHSLGLDRLQFARLIGFTGTDRNDVTRIRQYEGTGNSSKQVPLHIARFADLIMRHYLMFGKLPDFPDWDGYDFDHSPDPQHQKEPSDG